MPLNHPQALHLDVSACCSPPARLYLAGHGHDQPQWTGTPAGGEVCHYCMLGEGRSAAERHSAAHMSPTLQCARKKRCQREVRNEETTEGKVGGVRKDTYMWC